MLDKDTLDVSYDDIQVIHDTFKLKAYPNEDLRALFPQLTGNERFVWNKLVEFVTLHHQLFPDGPAPSKYDLVKAATAIRKMHSFLHVNDATGIQAVAERFAVSFKNMLQYFKDLKAGKYPRKVGFPHFKSYLKTVRAFGGKNVTKKIKSTIIPNDKVIAHTVYVVDNHHIKLPKIKEPLKVSSTKCLTGCKIKTYRLIYRQAGYYELVLSVTRYSHAGRHTGNVTAIDRNLTNLGTLPDGTTFKSFKTYGGHHLKELQHRSKVYQRKMSRAKHRADVIMAKEAHDNSLEQHTINDFKNYWKYRMKHNRYENKIKMMRKQYYEMIANKLLDKYDVIVLEDLNIKGMLKNHHVAKGIADSAWNTFAEILTYKARRRNKLVIKVSGAYTTQHCNNCMRKTGKDSKHDHIDWGVEMWKCPQCHHLNRRDQNAARNQLDKFLADPEKWMKKEIAKHREPKTKKAYKDFYRPYLIQILSLNK